MLKFAQIYEQALTRFPDEKELEKSLPVPSSTERLQERADNFYLSAMTRRVFRAGLKHAMVDNKWPAFEQVFYGFSPMQVAMMSDDELEALMNDKRIIRHWGKIKTVRHNAVFVMDVTQEHGSMGNFLAAWPGEDIIGLWSLLKKRASHMGGNSGPAFLRMVGKDTFLLTNDVVNAFLNNKILDSKPTSMKNQQIVQDSFNSWAAESGRPLCQISRLLSLTIH